ncbi:MAG: amidohydrolase family protein [Acidobacteria bacterium]|nr:amidohydrolase family protein [Acidobacteriota bacterium]
MRCGLRMVIVFLAAAAVEQAQPRAYDVLIRNVRVMDGSGNPWVRGEIGITGGRIAAIGRLGNAQAARVIDGGDLLATPGFIDVHSHAAEGLTRSALKQGQPILAQGVTTIVANPDGGGPVDLLEQRAELLKDGIGPNVALLIGHGSVRRVVMGVAERVPTASELDRMRAIVRTAMQNGAYGLSSGLFYTPGSYAATDEVIALAAAAGEFGGLYTSHIRDEGNYAIGMVAAVQEVIRIAEEARVIGVVTHMKALGPDSWGLSVEATKKIDEARGRGVQVFADQYPYEASSTNLGAAVLPGVDPSTLEKLLGKKDTGRPDERRARERIERTVRENLRRRGGPGAIQIAFYRPEPALQGKRLDEIAKARGVSPETAAIALMAGGVVSIVSFNMSEKDIQHIMTRPYTMASSDGGLALPAEGVPHPRDYGAFARRLAVYVRERQVVNLEFAVRSMTSLPATVFGMKDRGVLREGAAADLAIFDPAAVRDLATYSDPHRLAGGMYYVLVNGVVVVDKGVFTAARPGQVLRR